MIVLKVVNPKCNLSKEIDVTKYDLKEISKTFGVYMKAGYEVYVKQGIEQILKMRGVL